MNLLLLLGLYLNGSNYNDVAAVEQAAVEQYNIIHFLGGAAPYVQYPGYGIDPGTPETCEVVQVQYVGRHGERFPTAGSGAKYNDTIQFMKLQNLNGSLSFFSDYQYFVDDPANYGLETNTTNCQSKFAGSISATKNGAAFRQKYGHLYNGSLVVFTSNSQRVYDTSRFFAHGFLGEAGGFPGEAGISQGEAGISQGEADVKFNVISEDASLGGNSLTPKEGCKGFDDSFAASSKISTYAAEFNARAQRNGNPNLNLTVEQVQNLIDGCAYELNVKGSSPLCGIFTNEELIKREYADDVELYYNYGPGNNATAAIGSVFVKSSLKLLQEDSDTKIWLSFTHDNDIVTYYAALGMFDQGPLNKEKYTLGNTFLKGKIIPQSARVVLEKLNCGGDDYVRFIINDSVVPLDCEYGPGFSCSLEDYVEMMSNVSALDYNEVCGAGVPGEQTFYWDYGSVAYNATLEV